MTFDIIPDMSKSRFDTKRNTFRLCILGKFQKYLLARLVSFFRMILRMVDPGAIRIRPCFASYKRIAEVFCNVDILFEVIDSFFNDFLIGMDGIKVSTKQGNLNPVFLKQVRGFLYKIFLIAIRSKRFLEDKLDHMESIFLPYFYKSV